MRDSAGRWRKGASGNPGGRRREGAGFEAAARRILEADLAPEALGMLPAAARTLLPKAATYHDALAAVLVTASLAGEEGALRELLKRVWPAPKPVELSAGEGVGRTLADLLISIRHDRDDEGNARP